MSDKELLTTIKNDIKNIDKCVEAIYYLKSIKDNLVKQEIKLVKEMSIKKNTPTHYQGTIQPIDIINEQNLNFNLGNVVKYVYRAGKKQGENILTDLEKAKDYINFEIERVKK